MNRGTILETAHKLTTGDREAAYGDCYTNMSNFACLLGGYLQARFSVAFEAVDAEDAAHIMDLAKLARTIDHTLPFHADNYIDKSAYSAIAGQVAAQERDR